jgi:signal transduction histidine kinase
MTGGAVAGLVAASVVRFAYANPSLHLIVETAAALIGGLVAYLSFGRYRRSRHPGDLLVCEGLGLLMLANVALVVISVIPGGPHSDHLAAWSILAVRTVAGGVLGAASVTAVAAPSRARSRLAWGVFVAPPLVVAGLASAVALGVFPLDGSLPLSASERVHVATNPAVLVLLGLSALLFAQAGAGFAWRFGRSGDEFLAWLAGGCALSALASVSYVVFVPLNPRWFYTGDLFRLAAYLVWLVGVAREIAHYWSVLAQGAVAEERRRMARDLHDGMAQELAFITTQANAAARGEADASLLVQLGAAAQRALDEARRAIVTLTTAEDEPLPALLTVTASEVAGRYGLHLELDVAELAVAPAVREALVWIVREAVTNAGRHGQARDVSIWLREGTPARLQVHDDGSGFDPDQAVREAFGFGLVSMKERAQAIGAALTIESAKGRGTTVTLA